MTETINVEFLPNRYKPIKKRMPLTLGGITLQPGINRDVNPEITNHFYWQKLVDLRAVDVMADKDLPDAPTKAQKITLLNIDQAKELIKRTSDLTTLQIWNEEDGRKGVKELIARQIRFIESGE